MIDKINYLLSKGYVVGVDCFPTHTSVHVLYDNQQTCAMAVYHEHTILDDHLDLSIKNRDGKKIAQLDSYYSDTLSFDAVVDVVLDMVIRRI
jgi:hypothetical protein